MNFCRTLHARTRGLFDWKHVAENHHNKMADITPEKIEELRTTHRMSLKNEITPEQLKGRKFQEISNPRHLQLFEKKALVKAPIFSIHLQVPLRSLAH